MMKLQKQDLTLLMQEAFEYELAALTKFNAAKVGLEP